MGSGIDCSLDLLWTGSMYRKWTTGKFLFIKVPAIHGNCVNVVKWGKLLIRRQGLILHIQK